MDRELTPDEIAELLPAYALDAVDDDERARDRRRTSRAIPTTRDEVAELQVTASMLAHTGGPPPDGVWEQLESMIAESPPRAAARPRPDVVGPAARAGAVGRHGEPALAMAGGGRRGRRARVRRRSGWSTAVRRRRRRDRHRRAGARPPTTAPGARHAVLTDDDGNTLATAVVLARRHRLPHVASCPRCRRAAPTSSGASRRTGTISLGVLGRDPARRRVQGRRRPTSAPRDHRPRSRVVCR